MRCWNGGALLSRLAEISALIAGSIVLSGCGSAAERAAAAITGGNPQRGAAAITRYGCGSCHTIPGISGAHGLVGPSLAGVSNRMYIGGVLQNTPENLIRWVQNPKAVDEKTAMPMLHVTALDATDISAYLYSIK